MSQVFLAFFDCCYYSILLFHVGKGIIQTRCCVKYVLFKFKKTLSNSLEIAFPLNVWLVSNYKEINTKNPAFSLA